MPLPHLYASTADTLDAASGAVDVDVLYATDRATEVTPEGGRIYDSGRSESVAFGRATVRMQPVGNGRSTLALAQVAESGRMPPTPWPVVLRDGMPEDDPRAVAQAEQAAETLRAQIRSFPGASTSKEVLIYIHGVSNTFADAAYTLAELKHFMRSDVVPLLYAWPAGAGTGLFGYTHDRESGEFTVHHFKSVLKIVAGMPEVSHIHLVAHSRGADVVTVALRELVLQLRAAGADPRQRLRLKNLVLAAPDLDIEVLLQRSATARVAAYIGRVSVYTSKTDRALDLAEFLFSSVLRLGKADVSMFSSRVLSQLDGNSNIAIIEYVGEQAGSIGHSYFRTSPAVVSDLILTLRDGRAPGARYGRPLRHRDGAFWEIGDDYLLH